MCPCPYCFFLFFEAFSLFLQIIFLTGLQGGTILIPGFCLPRALQPLLPIFLQVRLNHWIFLLLNISNILSPLDNYGDPMDRTPIIIKQLQLLMVNSTAFVINFISSATIPILLVCTIFHIWLEFGLGTILVLVPFTLKFKFGEKMKNIVLFFYILGWVILWFNVVPSVPVSCWFLLVNGYLF